jgi:hypothetical protein
MSITTSLVLSATLILVPVASVNAARAASEDNGTAQKFEVRKNHAGRTVYCAEIAPATGSRISTTRCETIEDWKADGVELHFASTDG